MPTFVTTVITLIKDHWTDLLELGALTTAINQFVQRVLAPKYPSVGKIVNTITVDFWVLLTEVGKLLGIGKTPPSDGAKTVAKAGIIMLFVTMLVGCSGLFQFQPGIIDATCNKWGPVAESILAPIAAAFGIDVSEIMSVFGAVCQAEIQKGNPHAFDTAITAAQTKANAMHAAKVGACK